MKTDFPMARWLPYYLTIQITLMLSAVLDLPIFMRAAQAEYTLVTPWVVLCVILVVIGLVFGFSALVTAIRKPISAETSWMKLTGGYWIGMLPGLVALGIHFMNWMPLSYYYFIGGLMGLLALLIIGVKARIFRREELFP
jgi:hypothetical protein